MWSRLAVVGAFLFLLTDGAAVLAADPPGRVGRLSLVEGTVSLRSPQPVNADNAADNATPELKDEWAPAALNYPVTGGNSLWTESGAKAEVQVGPAEIRLNEQTELEVLRLDDRSVDLALHQGTANVHIGDAMPGGLLIDTPRGPVTLTQRGSYRIDVDTGGDSDTVQVTAFDGEAKVSVETPDRTDTHTVARGQSLKLAGEPVQIALADARTTAFDDWARSRDPRAVVAAPRTVVTGQPVPQAQVSPTVSPVSTQMTGYQDLAPYGTWQQAPDYGQVWYPATVTPEWAPYRYGHWAYVAPWGWTWIDDAPWGFTPFHYGRWVRVGPRWAWWPGHRTVRPVYAPALVAFVGGNGWSLSIGSGRARPVGWVPLAPYEVYRPHYRTSATYIRNVNITTVNKTVINNITVNNNHTEINRFTNRTAMTAVSADNFARGRRVNEAKIDVPRKELERAKATNDVRAIRPQQVAARADAPRPVERNEARREERRANPAITSREPNRGNERRDPAIERRNAAIQATPQSQNQNRNPERSQERNQPREQRRDAAPQPTLQAAPQQQREETQGRQRRDQVQQQQRTEQQQRDQAQEQQRQRDVQERQQRDQAQDQQRREQQEQRQRRERPPQEQRSEQIQPQPQPQQQQRQQLEQQQAQQQIMERQQRREAQQRQQAEQQQRADEQVRVQRQRDAQEQQQREVQRRQAQDQQAREAAGRDAAREQQLQQQHAQEQQRREQAGREQRQREIAQEQQQREQQQQQLRQREQAAQQQRQQAEQQQRAQQEQQRAQAEQQRQQRDQAQQQQRQAQEQQRAQQDQQRQQQEQAQGEQRRRNPEGRPDGKRNRDG